MSLTTLLVAIFEELPLQLQGQYAMEKVRLLVLDGGLNLDNGDVRTSTERFGKALEMLNAMPSDKTTDAEVRRQAMADVQLHAICLHVYVCVYSGVSVCVCACVCVCVCACTQVCLLPYPDVKCSK
jgi:hypothetical protein